MCSAAWHLQEKLKAAEARRTAVDAAMLTAAARLFSSPDIKDLLMQNMRWTWGNKAGKCPCCVHHSVVMPVMLMVPMISGGQHKVISLFACLCYRSKLFAISISQAAC
jgi:hypothetical protein